MSAEVKRELGVEDKLPLTEQEPSTGLNEPSGTLIGPLGPESEAKSGKMNFGVMKLKRGKQSEIADRKNMNSVAEKLGTVVQAKDKSLYICC